MSKQCYWVNLTTGVRCTKDFGHQDGEHLFGEDYSHHRAPAGSASDALRKGDSETEALRTIVDALEALDPFAQARVSRYINARFGSDEKP